MVGLAVLLKTVILGALASAIARAIIGAGLAFITYQAIEGYVEGFMDQMASSMSGLPANFLAIMSMMGIPTAIEIIASAMLTVLSIKLTDRIMGVKFTGS